jgi:hypothetical protein
MINNTEKSIAPMRMAAAKNTKLVKTRKNICKFAKIISGGDPNDRLTGSKNKLRARIMDKIIEINGQLTLEGKGLLNCARDNPKWFYEKIFVKVLPINIELSTASSPILIEIIENLCASGRRK